MHFNRTFVLLLITLGLLATFLLIIEPNGVTLIFSETGIIIGACLAGVLSTTYLVERYNKKAHPKPTSNYHAFLIALAILIVGFCIGLALSSENTYGLRGLLLFAPYLLITTPIGWGLAILIMAGLIGITMGSKKPQHTKLITAGQSALIVAAITIASIMISIMTEPLPKDSE